MNRDDNRFYVYGHYKADNGELFYIGKGSHCRSKSKNNRSKAWHAVVKLHGFYSRILKSDLTNGEALLVEKTLILENKSDLINKNIPSTVNTYDYKDIYEMFIYDDTSPSCLRWKIDRANSLGRLRKYAGKVAGSLGKNWIVEYKGKSIPVHRIIYYLFNPSMDFNLDIDHIDGNPSNNRIENLRLVSKSYNSRNRILKSSTGFTYVYKRTDKGCPHFFLKIPNGKTRKCLYFYIKDFESEDAALQACLSARENYVTQLKEIGVTDRILNK